MAGPHHRPVEIPHVAIEVIIVNPQVLMDRRDLPPLVLLGPAQHLRDVHRLPVLNSLRVPQQQVLDAVVYQGDLVEGVHQAGDTVGATQALEQLVLALLHVLSGHLHSHGVSSGDVSTDGLQSLNGVLQILRLDSHLLENIRKDIQQAIKMVVRKVQRVVGGTNIAELVARRASEKLREEGHQLLFVHRHLSLILLEETLSAHVRCGLLIHLFHEVGNPRIATQTFIDRLGRRRFLGLAHIVRLPVDENITPRRLHDHDGFVDGIGVGPHIPERRLCVFKEAIELEI
mmetsp:Transcript_19151/g.42352  ORF Transcript_19151/g.42352 Transcript_19151/m.42352 type:complete len:287 (-) Transcript_19151:1785-2645(-)